jgi:hypothetical protein
MKPLTTRLDLIYRCCGLSSAINKEGYEQGLIDHLCNLGRPIGITTFQKRRRSPLEAYGPPPQVVRYPKEAVVDFLRLLSEAIICILPCSKIRGALVIFWPSSIIMAFSA